MERLTKKELCDYTTMDFHSIQMDWHSIYNKLAEFEDFMEENGYPSLSELKSVTEYTLDSAITLVKENNELRTINSGLVNKIMSLNNRWKKLKEFIKEKESYEIGDYPIVYSDDVIIKMQELEGGDEVVKD